MRESKKTCRRHGQQGCVHSREASVDFTSQVVGGWEDGEDRAGPGREQYCTIESFRYGKCSFDMLSVTHARNGPIVLAHKNRRTRPDQV